MFEALLYIGGTTLMIYTIMPLLVYTKVKLPKPYAFIPLNEDLFLAKQNNKFKLLVFEINKNHFNCIACSSFKNQETYTSFSIFVHPDKTFYLLLTEIKNPNVPTLLYLEVYQLFDDYTSISIINSPIMGAFPKSSHKVILRFPKVIEVSELLATSEKIIHNYLSSKIPISLNKGEELEMMGKFLDEEQQELMDKGYVQNNKRNLTLKGAYSMTWKMLFPIKQIRNFIDLAFAQRILTDCKGS